MAQFSAEQVGAAIVIRCEANLARATYEESIEIIQGAFDRAKLPDAGISWIVLDLQNKFEFDTTFLRGVSKVAVEIRKQGITLAVLNASSEAQSFLLQSGMGSAIRIITLADLSKGRSKQSDIDVAFINPFLEGVLLVLKVQCSLEAKAEPLRLKALDERYTVDIAGVIGIVSRSFTGSVSICFPEKTFLGIMSRMLSEEFSEITRDLEDGAGELLNMVFGHAKRVLNENGHSFDKAIPTIVRGKNIEIRNHSPGPTVILPFSSIVGDFRVEIGIDRAVQAKT